MDLPENLEKEICFTIQYASDGMELEEAESLASVVFETVVELLEG